MFSSIRKKSVDGKGVAIEWRLVFREFSRRSASREASDAGVNPRQRWALLQRSELDQSWRPGGAHFVAGHRSGLLYVGMNQDGPDSHKQPAQQIWVMKIDDMSRHQVIEPLVRSLNWRSLKTLSRY